MKGFLGKLFGSRPGPGKRPLAAVRAAAPEVLRQALLEAADDGERERCRRELADALAQPGAGPLPSDDAAVWAATICRAGDKAAALQWLDQLQGDEWLAQVAVRARSAEVRLAAARRITDPDRLRSLAEAVRDKDRGVYRHCQEILRSQAEEDRRAQAIGACRHRLAAVLVQCPLAAGVLYELRREVARLGEGADMAECIELLERAGEREQREARQVRGVEEAAARARSLRRVLERDLNAGADALDEWRDSVLELRRCLAECPDWLVSSPAALELAQSLKRVEARLGEWEEERNRFLRCQQFLAELTPESVDEAVRRDWARLGKPDDPAALAQLQSIWDGLSAAPRSAAEPAPAPASPRDLGPARRLLEALEEALDAGRSHDASAHLRQLDRLAKETPLPRSLADRQRRAAGRLARLRGWARWSGSRVREELLEAAEALQGDDVDLQEKAEGVPRLRSQWQKLDREGRAPQAQQQRFDELLNRAYEPVQQRRAEQAEQARAARAAKEEWLGKWQSWVDGVDWEQTDYGEIQKRRQLLRTEWRSQARASGRDERRLQARYEALAAALDARLGPVIEGETERRERLIAGAERLLALQPIQEAVVQARNLQQKWKDGGVAVQLPRQLAEGQWQRFRMALDQVFARRDAQRNEQDAKRQEENAARQALLRGLEEVLAVDPNRQRLEQELATFRSRWDSLAEGEERRRRDDLDRRAAELIERTGHAMESLRQRKEREVFEALASRAALAERAEAAAAEGSAEEGAAADIEQSWSQLASLPGEWERLLRERLQQAAAITPARLAEATAKRAALLLDLEILLELPTPAELAAGRQGRQLEMLQAGRQARPTPDQIRTMVATWYALPAPEDAGQAGRMAQVVDRIVGVAADS